MFKFNAEWDVDKSAESLNTSLFGKSKKHKTIKAAVQVPANSGSQNYSSKLPDSDDEQYSKKDKKKLKKIRKKNKQGGMKNLTDSPELHQQHQSLDSLSTATKKNVKSKNKTVHNAEHKLSVNTSPVKLVTAGVKNKKRKQKDIKDIQPSGIIKGNNRKRKLSASENADNSKVCKKVKVEENKDNTLSANDSAVSETGKKKRKRNRKKKNNSKKNKYKHLALNSKTNTGDLDLPHGDSYVTTEKKTTDKNDIYEPAEPNFKNSFENINKKMDISQATETGVQTKVQTECIQKDKNSYGADQLSLGKRKSNKRKQDNKNLAPHNKSLSDNPQPPTKKAKKKKDNLKLETSADTSQFQHVQSGKLNPAVSDNLVKNKKKQILLKMLNGTQVKQQDKIDNNNIEVNNSNKKKRKIVERTSLSKSLDGNNQASKKQAAKNKLTNSMEQDDLEVKPSVNLPSVSQSIWGKAAMLGQQAKEKLDSARFRYINEQLYSCRGNEALQLFKEDQDAFSVYHDGFQNQVNKWPVNPLEVFIKQIKEKPKNFIIADFGCGDAKLAQCVPQKVHSFDLVALNKRVTACDMSKTPLPSEHVDVAVCCLSLMGTNITDYIQEANRVLKTGGLLKIAEVVSRFSGLSRFTDSVCSCGFQLLNKRDLNQMFYIMDFKKIKTVKKSASLPAIKLKPCIYKRR